MSNIMTYFNPDSLSYAPACLNYPPMLNFSRARMFIHHRQKKARQMPLHIAFRPRFSGLQVHL